MNPKIGRVLFPALLMISFFSLWAAFALLIINPLFYEDLPGYTIGRICVWEYVAMGVAVLIAKMLISKWGNIEFQEIGRKKVIILNANYGI